MKTYRQSVKASLNNQALKALVKDYTYLSDYFADHPLAQFFQDELSLKANLDQIDPVEFEDLGSNKEAVFANTKAYIEQMNELLGIKKDQIEKLSVLAGQNKLGEQENFSQIDLYPSEIIAIVGPTGSGKSRLLADIEWMAQGDTPTKRYIKINDDFANPNWRYSSNYNLVAQLSQNMNFVMDLQVREFLEMHAASRLIDNPALIDRIIEQANYLAGESFLDTSPITALSGGQSRALMIADTALLSASPIVLIDELENAGIEREKALSLLIAEDKIVLMATHDPALALLAHRRLIIQNGGIHKVIERSQAEEEIAEDLAKYDQRLRRLRNQLRHGESLKW